MDLCRKGRDRCSGCGSPRGLRDCLVGTPKVNLKQISSASLLVSWAGLALACSVAAPESNADGGSSHGGGSNAPSSENGAANIDLTDPNTEEKEPDSSGVTGDGCAASSAQSEVQPATLLIALDRSSSMVPSTGSNRWELATEALTAFLGDPSSVGLSASLQMFPSPSSNQSKPETFCPSSIYDVPDVSLTALPNAEPFALAIEGAWPKGLTPTHGVLTSLIGQAEAVLEADPQNNVAIVLVNDGEPKGCDDVSTVDAVVGLVGTAASRIPTYVIGIGDELEALHGIAEAGGTGTAVLVDVTDPTAARLEVLERLNAIRSEVGGCDAAIPAPPSGQILDPLKVSTQLKDPAGSTVPVPYEADCETGVGWHYDDLDSPTSISLCAESCRALQASESSLDVVFGCEINSEIIK